jgi:hypothetical protein
MDRELHNAADDPLRLFFVWCRVAGSESRSLTEEYAMDPSVTWCDMAQAVQEDRWLDAEEHARNLLAWLQKGGFPPTITGTPTFDRIAARTTCQAILAWDI